MSEEISQKEKDLTNNYNTENSKVLGELLKVAKDFPEKAQEFAQQYPSNPIAQQYLADALKNKSSADKVLQYLTVDTPTGPEYAAGMMDGSPRLTGMKVAKPLKFVGQGDSTQGVNQYTGASVGEALPINVSPDAQLRANSKSGNDLPER